MKPNEYDLYDMLTRLANKLASLSNTSAQSADRVTDLFLQAFAWGRESGLDEASRRLQRLIDTLPNGDPDDPYDD